jgi:D-alanyl-D-alanine carboxypeptidase
MKDEVEYLLNFFDVPGALVLLKSDVYDSFLIKYGYSDLENYITVNVKDKFRVGSNTKMFTGIVFLQLYQEGLVDLDAPVSDYLLDFPKIYKDVTIRQVGSMRSGIFNYTLDPEFQKELQEDPYKNWIPEEMYNIGMAGPRSFLPGTQAEYCNTNTLILGFIIEKITGNLIQDEIKKRILEPLKLTSTKFQTEGCFGKPHMNGYEYNDNNELKDVTHYNPSWAWASGNMSSNLKDMTKFIKYGVGKDVLLNRDGRTQHKTWQPVPADFFTLDASYGFQLIKLENFVGHNGGIFGYNTYSLYEPQTKTTLIVFINIQYNKQQITPAVFIAEYIIARLNNKTTFEETKIKFDLY